MKALRSFFVHPLPPPAGLLPLEVRVPVLFDWAFDSADLTSHANDAPVMAANQTGVAVESASYADGVHERLVSTCPLVDEQGHRDPWRSDRG